MVHQWVAEWQGEEEGEEHLLHWGEGEVEHSRHPHPVCVCVCVCVCMCMRVCLEKRDRYRRVAYPVMHNLVTCHKDTKVSNNKLS